MTEVQSLSDVILVKKFESLVTVERKTTAELVEYLIEIDKRKLYLHFGHTSLFGYLTRGLGYTPASAQRRIDAARLSKSIPEISQHLNDGSLNLMQVSMMAQGVKQKSREDATANITIEQKKKILDEIRHKNIEETQKIIARSLDLKVLQLESRRSQKDGSVRLQFTLTAEQMWLLERVKELKSHVCPDPSWAEVIAGLAAQYIEKHDPLVKGQAKAAVRSSSDGISVPEGNSGTNNSAHASATSKMEAAPNHNGRAVPTAVRRAVFQRDRCCQWRDPVTGALCGSKFQLEIDHRQSLWAGGSNDPANLQVLCSVHNKIKYRLEAGIRPIFREPG